MSELIAAMIAAGGPTCTDARDHWPLHQALVRLGSDAPESASLPLLRSRPDPEVGRRVHGVTRALWDLVGCGLLCVDNSQDDVRFIVDTAELPRARRGLMRLDPQSQMVVYAAAERWALASTSRKNPANERESSVATRRRSDRYSRQVVEPSSRQRAVSRS